MSNDNEEKREKLLQLVREVVQRDKELREQFQIGDKFRFIRDRLQALLVRVEESLILLQEKSIQKVNVVLEDESPVYVYLYNAQGLQFKTWQNMVGASVFYEYSVNRPIYAEKAQIDAFIRSRTNKAQHGYLTIAVKKSDIIKPEEKVEDMIGNPLIKVREGALKVNRMISFTHNGQDYILDEEGELVKKEESKI